MAMAYFHASPSSKPCTPMGVPSARRANTPNANAGLGTKQPSKSELHILDNRSRLEPRRFGSTDGDIAPTLRPSITPPPKGHPTPLWAYPNMPRRHAPVEWWALRAGSAAIKRAFLRAWLFSTNIQGPMATTLSSLYRSHVPILTGGNGV